MKKEEYERWQNSCDFIDKEMQFYSWQDFLDSCVQIKRLYKESNSLIKRLYQWYVYSKKLRYHRKNAIWDYINDYITAEKLKKTK